uniref:Uncharacterized protein n=1 Tax=Anguilla anguilla TaxID=7936 RepID=A0A0E9U7G0_ANGAN
MHVIAKQKNPIAKIQPFKVVRLPWQPLNPGMFPQNGCVCVYISIKSDIIRMNTFLIRCRPLESNPQCLCVFAQLCHRTTDRRCLMIQMGNNSHKGRT